MMWNLGGFGFLWMALFWVGMIMLVARAVGDNGDRGRSSPTALGVLEERFARGEVDADEFTARRRELAHRRRLATRREEQ